MSSGHAAGPIGGKKMSSSSPVFSVTSLADGSGVTCAVGESEGLDVGLVVGLDVGLVVGLTVVGPDEG